MDKTELDLLTSEEVVTHTEIVDLFELPRFTFDGRQFYRPDRAADLAVLYLAAQARRGDPLAVELLTQTDVRIHDAEGGSYWPVEGGG